MSEKPKRPWFRFHLLTAVALVLIAGAFIGANLTNRLTFWQELRFYLHGGTEHRYGWPMVAYEAGAIRCSDPDRGEREYTNWNQMAIAVDCISGIGLLLAAATASEWLIRRREARKT
jgi:hypothetical protein